MSDDAEVIVLYQSERDELLACIRFWDRFMAGEIGPNPGYTLTDEETEACLFAQQQARDELAALDEEDA